MVRRAFRIPAFEDDPLKWSAAWERVYETTEPKDLLRERVAFMEEYPALQDELLSNHLVNLRRLCYSQKGLAQNAATFFVMRDFEAKWRGAEASVREKHLLQGLYQTCWDVPDTASDRIYCDDLTLPQLQKENGEGFLRLLKAVMVCDSASNSNHPVFVPNSRWDVLKQNPKRKLSALEEHAWEEIAVGRGAFIAEFLLHVLQSFHGLPPPPINKIKGRSSGHLDKDTKESMNETLGRSAAKAFRQGLAADRRSRPRRCENCDRSPEELGHSQFMVCRNCKEKVGRSVFYCSPKCQKEDWKPRHKMFCGRPMTLNDMQQRSQPNESFGTIGPPHNGYNRTDALQLQVTLLNLHPDVDYYLIKPTGERLTCTVPFPNLKTIFRQHRDKALSTGDQLSVGFIATVLLDWGAHRGEMLTQLEKEYGFDVEAMVLQVNQMISNASESSHP